MTRSSNKELFEPYDEPEQALHSLRKLFKTTSFDHSCSPKFELFFYYEEQVKEETVETMAEPTIEEYTKKPKRITSQELRDNTFSGSENEDANENIERVLEIVDLFTISDVTQDQLIGAARRWTSTRNKNSNTSDGLATIQAQLNNLGREIKKVNERVYVAHVGCELCDGPHYSKNCSLKEEGKTFEKAYYSQFGVPFPNAERYRANAPGFYQRDNGNPSYQERRQMMEETLNKIMAESTKRHDENSSLIKEFRALTDATIRNQGASIKALEIQIRQMSKVLQERGPGSLPSSTEINPKDHVKSISTTNEADIPSTRHMEPTRYGVSSPRKDDTMQMIKLSRTSVPFHDSPISPTSNIIKKVYMLGLRKRMELDLETRLMGESLILNRSRDYEFGDFLKLNDLNEPLELRNHENKDLGPTIEEGEIVNEPMVDVAKISVEPRRKGGKEVLAMKVKQLVNDKDWEARNKSVVFMHRA
ncbi:hypothetical protein Tco_0128508 [Tanacetum coccineum]